MYRNVSESNQKGIRSNLSWRNQRMEHFGPAGRASTSSVRHRDIENPGPVTGFSKTYAKYAATMRARGLKPLPPKALIDPKRKKKSRAHRKDGGAGR